MKNKQIKYSSFKRKLLTKLGINGKRLSKELYNDREMLLRLLYKLQSDKPFGKQVIVNGGNVTTFFQLTNLLNICYMAECSCQVDLREFIEKYYSSNNFVYMSNYKYKYKKLILNIFDMLKRNAVLYKQAISLGITIC